MARETFPIVSKGDRLAARHVNDLSRVARYTSQFMPGAFQNGREGVTSGLPPFNQIRVAVVEVDVDGVAGQYRVKPRFYDHDNSEWVTDTASNAFDLDTTDTDGFVLIIEDKLDVYWSNQREAFLPVNQGTIPQIIVGKADNGIDAEAADIPGEGLVTIWERPNGGAWTATQDTVVCLNFSENAIEANEFLVLSKHTKTGEYVAIFENCPLE